MTAARNEVCPGVGTGATQEDSAADLNLVSHLTLDERHAAWLAGYDQGLATGRQDASVDLACVWLHTQACEYAGIAQRTANERHGTQWGETIAQAAEVAR